MNTVFIMATMPLSCQRVGVNQVAWDDNFAYAQGLDEASGRYQNLMVGRYASVATDCHAVVVKAEAGKRQLEEERKRREEQEKIARGIDDAPGDGHGGAVIGGDDGPGIAVNPERKLRRSVGVVEIDPVMAGSGAGKVACCRNSVSCRAAQYEGHCNAGDRG